MGPTGDTMCCFDCELMPRLQHIRVAGAFFADFHIPGDLKVIWKYYEEMYKLDAFNQSCPADQDIINHYKRQPSPILCLKQSKKHLHIKQNLYFDEPSPFSIQPSQNTKLNENVTTKAFYVFR